MNIYVGNLNYNVDDNDLNTIFGEFGTVSSAKVIKDQYSGKGKGFGFIEMSNDSEALSAIDKLNGAEIQGRAMTVNEAKPKKSRNNY